MIENGWYWHFKGGLYEVIGTAIHTETNEEMEDLQNLLTRVTALEG